jgi:hypothetical protein
VCGRKNYRLQNIQLSKNPPSPHCGFGVTGPEGPIVELACLGDLSASQDEAPSEVIGAKSGGEYRARTGDLLVANQALSQLS